MTRLYLNQLISRNKYLTKLFSIFIFLLLIMLFGLVSQSFSNAQVEEVENEKITTKFADEINPFCNGLSYFDNNKLRYFDLTQIEIDIFNDLGWNTNVFRIISSEDKVIKPEYKNKFNGLMNIHVENGDKSLNISCSFDIEIRISGDWTDHINRKNGMTSLDVKLLNGNIDGITKFKLFAPRSRHYENEIFVTTLLEMIGFLSPRTSFVDVVMDDFNGQQIFRNNMIFQEKFSKEMIEYYGFREGPLIETDESLRWATIIDNNFTEPDRRYFMPAKVLNKYWSRKSENNQIITLEALELYNKAIFSSNQPWTQLNYDYLGLNTNRLYKFDAALIALDSNHAITNHQRKFYFNKIENQFYPIYYDGDTKFLWESGDYSIRGDYENFSSLGIGAKELLDELNLDEDAIMTTLNLTNVEYSNGDVNYPTLTYEVTAIPDSNIGIVYLADGTTEVETGLLTIEQLRGLKFKPELDAAESSSFQFSVTDSEGASISETINIVNNAPYRSSGTINELNLDAKCGIENCTSKIQDRLMTQCPHYASIVNKRDYERTQEESQILDRYKKWITIISKDCQGQNSVKEDNYFDKIFEDADDFCLN